MSVNQEKMQWKNHWSKIDGSIENRIEQESNEILEYTIPVNITELRRFLEMTELFNNFIERYAMKTTNLSERLK